MARRAAAGTWTGTRPGTWVGTAQSTKRPAPHPVQSWAAGSPGTGSGGPSGRAHSALLHLGLAHLQGWRGPLTRWGRARGDEQSGSCCCQAGRGEVLGAVHGDSSMWLGAPRFSRCDLRGIRRTAHPPARAAYAQRRIHLRGDHPYSGDLEGPYLQHPHHGRALFVAGSQVHLGADPPVVVTGRIIEDLTDHPDARLLLDLQQERSAR